MIKQIHFGFKHSMILLLAIIFLTACSSGENTASTEGNSNDNNNSSSEVSNYPEQPIDFLVGYAAGGGTDTMARKIGEGLEKLGLVEANFTVHNMPGASGVNAFTESLKKPSDPYKLIAIPEIGVPLINGTLDAKLEDFKPIAQVYMAPMAIAVSKDAPYENVTELLDAMKEDPKSIVISTASAIDGSEPLKWNQIAKAYGIEGELNIVPTGGGAEALVSLLNGDADASINTVANFKDYEDKGDLKILAILTPERMEEHPNTPTLVENGIDITYIRSYGVWTGGEVDDEIVAFWEENLKQLVASDFWKEYAKTAGNEPEFVGTKDYVEYLKKEGTAHMEYIQQLNN